MAEEKETTGRQLKIRGMNEEDAGEDREAKKESKESESKVWVLVILAVSVLISLLFSLKAGGASWWGRLVSREGRSETSRSVEVESVREGGVGWFGPAVYELD